MNKQNSDIIDVLNLKPGTKYLVRHFTRISDKTPGRLIKRIFFGTEVRFGSITCLIFSTRYTNDSVSLNELSIPHYLIADIKLECHG